LTVITKYGFGDLAAALEIERYLEIGLRIITLRKHEKIDKMPREVRFRKMLEELGPTFMKLGQILSTRPDLMPAEFITELSKLQDNVQSFPYEKAAEIVTEEFGKPISEIFLSFDEEPIAAASIGQVHRAVLADGSNVAVKIQRPDINSVIEVDLEILAHMAELAEKHLKEWSSTRPVRIVEEFARTMARELDYTVEAAYMERFARQFENEQAVYVPKVYRDATTSRILTMEYISGVRVKDVDGLAREGLDRKIIARQGLVLILKQIFEHGFFHADPHPGNIFVLPDNVICYIDFGMMGRISIQNRETLADFIISIVNRNEKEATKNLLKLTEQNEEINFSSLESDVTDIMDQYCYRPLKDLNVGSLLQHLLEIILRHELSVLPDLILLIKAMSTVEGIGLMLDPELDVVNEAEPFIKEIKLKRLNPLRMTKDIAESGAEFFKLFKEIPTEFRTLLKMLRKGKIRMEFEHRGLEEMLVTFDRISNRISFALVLASLVIGSALIVLSGIPPKWHEVPIIGLAGFILAGFMGFGLLVSILRRGKL
jgi:ubiquinone biosynthesis protein